MATKGEKIVVEKKVAPKPEGHLKKEERDTKYAQALQKAKEARRVSNVTKRADILKRSQDHEQNYLNQRSS
jgi:hypothetical protein